MELSEFSERHREAGAEFNRHENRDDGAAVAGSLAAGLTVLRESLYARLHADVQRVLGMDSMLMPLSEVKTAKSTKVEIELYQIAVSAAAAAQCSYVSTNDDWYLKWLARLRLVETGAAAANVSRRVTQYFSKTPDDRRLAFTDVMAKALPESRRAPLVVFRLAPLSVELATALSFGDRRGASGVRERQLACLPAIGDCPQCRGRLLENGDQCDRCGNPLWRFRWLTAAD